MGDGVDQEQLVGQLVAGQHRGQEVPQLGQLGWAGSTGNDAGADCLAQDRVRRGDLTALSATPGWVRTAASTSLGDTWRPPRLTSSLSRPRTYTLPSGSIRPRSPVRYHPSVAASASFQ